MATDTLRPAAHEPGRAGSEYRLRALRGPLPSWLGSAFRLVALVLYVTAVVAVAARHEPWFDEAQAWLLARDDSLPHLLASQMRYEGSPPLWHLLLMGPAKLGAPYIAITVIAVAIAIAGAYVLVRYSPFPLPLTLGVLFSFVVAYQYAVVARSYVLLPLLLFLLAMAWPRRTREPWPFVVVLGLLASASTHGLFVAGGVFVAHMVHLWRPLDESPLSERERLSHWQASLAFLTLCALIVIELWPAPDQSLGSGFNTDLPSVLEIAPAVLNSALAGAPVLSFGAVALSLWWLWRTRTLLLWGLPTLALLALAAVKYHNRWHDGILFLVWIFALWVGTARGPVGGQQSMWDRWARSGAYLAMAGVLVVQGGWWWRTVQHDWTYPYSGSRQLAAWLAEQPSSKTIYAIGFHALAALPYLDRNVYTNNNGGGAAYMHWSTSPRLDDRIWSVWLARPDAIVWAVRSRKALTDPAMPGYERVAVFAGDMYWKDRAIERDTYFVFEPIDRARS